MDTWMDILKDMVTSVTLPSIFTCIHFGIRANVSVISWTVDSRVHGGR